MYNITFFKGGFLIQLVWGSQDMPMHCNAMLKYVKKENNFVLFSYFFPFPVSRHQILFFNQKTYICSFCIKINRDYRLPLLNFSGFSLE